MKTYNLNLLEGITIDMINSHGIEGITVIHEAGFAPSLSVRKIDGTTKTINSELIEEFIELLKTKA